MGVAPHGRTVFYLNDEEAEIILGLRRAVQKKRRSNRRPSDNEQSAVKPPKFDGGDTVQIIDHPDLPRQYVNETWLGRIGKVYVVYPTTYPARITVTKPRFDNLGNMLPVRYLAVVDFRSKSGYIIQRTLPAIALEKLSD